MTILPPVVVRVCGAVTPVVATENGVDCEERDGRVRVVDGDTELVDGASEVLDEGSGVLEGCSEVLGGGMEVVEESSDVVVVDDVPLPESIYIMS